MAYGDPFGMLPTRLATSSKLLRFTSRGGSRLPKAIQTLEQIGSSGVVELFFSIYLQFIGILHACNI